ncbi:hypothetical protein [Tenacibaculum finnmarkense]|uniref:hypothetical protein n=1 Tax=Tenacibaculum finnmarkense TaxID=2781243 RepID=UPI00187B6DA7|nr:hypothetical protein [Tenacibaculum finnmarkense]MBE7649145.1 hypothetical protein [Tenacibaculum finnmarkense genomovar ulcerans]
MTVKDLIEKLKELPQDARVFHLWDGEPRTAINVVYETKNGAVMTADYEQVCYSSSARPKEAPDSEKNSCWETEKKPQGYTAEDDWDY